MILTPVAFCHALGHVMSNVSFAAVAVSFTHTIKGRAKCILSMLILLIFIVSINPVHKEM